MINSSILHAKLDRTLLKIFTVYLAVFRKSCERVHLANTQKGSRGYATSLCQKPTYIRGTNNSVTENCFS